MKKIAARIAESWKLLPGMFVALIINFLLLIAWIVYTVNSNNITGILVATLLLPALTIFVLNLGWLHDKDR